MEGEGEEGQDSIFGNDSGYRKHTDLSTAIADDADIDDEEDEDGDGDEDDEG